MKNRYCIPLVAAAVSAALIAQRADAQTVWTGAGADPNWSNTANWNIGVVPDGPTETVLFGASPQNGVTVDGFMFSVGALQFEAGADPYAISIAQDNMLAVLDDGVTNLSAHRPTFYNSGTLLFDNNATAGNSTLVTENFGLTIFAGNTTAADATVITNDGGVFDLSGLSASTFHAASIAGSGDYVLGSANLTTGADNTSTAVSGHIGGLGALTKVGTGTLTLTGSNSYRGGTTISEGTIAIASNVNLGVPSGRLTLDGGTLQVSSTSFGMARPVTIAAGGGTFEVGTSTTSRTLIAAGLVSGPGALTKAGAGLLSLSNAANSYAGGTHIAGGTVSITGNGSLGASSGGVTFDGGTLRYANSFSMARPITLNAGSGTIDTNGFNETLTGAIAGTGGLTKVGAGTLALNGIGTYTGATTIGNGTMELSNGGQLNGTSGITLAPSSGESATLRVTGAGSSVTTAGSIAVGNSGSGTLTIDDGGSLTASQIVLGENAGAIGTLNIGSGGAAGALNAGTIASGSGSGAVIIDHAEASYTLSASVRFALSLTHNGTGTTTLTGSNSYRGGTFLNSGTLRVTSNSQLGAAVSGLHFNGGTLKLDAVVPNMPRSIVLGPEGGTIEIGGLIVNVTGAVSGTGRLTKTGEGLLGLLSPSTHSGGFTVLAGTLRGNANSLRGDILNDATVQFLQVPSGSYTGVMSGSGTLRKLGPGDLAMTAANTFTGGSTISTGTLTVTGSLASGVTVDESGTLAGTGTIAGDVGVFGTLAPGDLASAPYGTLTLNGNLTFQPGSIFRVRTNELGENSKVSVAGASHAATLNGGSVEVLTGGGLYEASTGYTLLTAAGGVTGVFDDVYTDFEFLTPELSYDTNNVYLTLTRNDVAFVDVAQTANQISVASYLESMGDDGGGRAVTAAVLNSNADSARATFTQIGGDGLASFGEISRRQTAGFMESLATRLHADSFEPVPASGMWMRSFSSDGSARGNESAASPEWRGFGTAVGFDARVSDNALVGVSFVYGRTAVELDGRRAGAGRIKSPQLVTYATYSLADDGATRWQVRGLLGYAQPTFSADRFVTLGQSTTIARSTHDGRELSAAGEAEVSYEMRGARLSGTVGLRASRLAEDGFTETGSAANLEMASRTTNSLASSVGARLVVPAYRNHGLFDLRAVFSRELGSLDSNLSGRLASSTSDARFTVSGVPVQRNALTFGAGFSGRLKRNLSYYADYSLQMRGAGETQHTGLAGMRLVW